MRHSIYLKRTLSLIIDLLVNSLVSVFLIMLFSDYVREIGFVYVLSLVHLVNTSFVLIATKRSTAGQLLVKIGVVSEEVTIFRVLSRNAIFCLFFFGSIVSKMVLLLFLMAAGWIFFSEKRQTLWDELTKTNIA